MKAVNLLDTTELPIMDIAMDVGFNNLSHFYHQFKKVYGYSPNKFRQEFMYADDHLEATKQSDIEKGYS
jgi:AraC-like DNA-binding protein